MGHLETAPISPVRMWISLYTSVAFLVASALMLKLVFWWKRSDLARTIRNRNFDPA
jgi:hypothetical protein